MLKSLMINGQAMQLPVLPTQHAQGLSLALYYANTFDWNTAPVTGLRALELKGVNLIPGLQQLLDIMAANPCLERLSIDDTYLHSDPKAKLPKVTMPNLRYISFSTPNTSERLIDLITHLVVPPNCCLDIWMFAGEIAQNFSELASKLFGYLCERINRLDHNFSVEMQINQGWHEGLILACPPTNPVIFGRFGRWVTNFTIEDGVRHIIGELEPAFRGTRELRFSGREFVSAVSIWNLPQLSKLFIQYLPHLSRLAVPSASWALECLTYPEPTRGWVSPNLQHLRLVGGEWQPGLVELLESRRGEPGVKTIETIVLDNVRVEPSNLEALKELPEVVMADTSRSDILLVKTETVPAKKSPRIETSLRTLLQRLQMNKKPSSVAEADQVLKACRAIRSAATGIRLSLLNQWNARQPIGQLPNELLHEILQRAFVDDELGRIRRPTAYFTRQQALRRVSSRWNQLINSSPSFWNTLCCTDTRRKRFEIALEKSGNVGLHVFCKFSKYCDRFAERMAEASHRWVSLDIIYNSWWNKSLLLPKPLLMNLRVNGRGYRLPALPTQYAPGLSVVLIHTTGFPWEIAPAMDLRALDLTSVCPGPDLGQLLDIVSANPRLERLRIGDMWLSRPTTPGLRNIAAPNLRYLGFPTPSTRETFIDFITHLIIPPSCSVHIRMSAGEIVDNIPGLIEKLFGYTCERVNQLDQTLSVGVRLDSGYWWGVVLSCPPINPTITVRFSWWLHRLSTEEGLRIIADQLEPAFRGTRELCFAGTESPMGPWSLPKIMDLWSQRLPRLSRLTVPSNSWALDRLTTPQPEYGWAYPNLQRLRLVGGGWQSTLVELTENRRGESTVKTIETIVLENIHVEPQNLEALGGLVGELVVVMPN
ncbi:hypothetical protein FRC00_011276 [Tulasnella sp. 408]|nr:hypothetical protein FRC00_011276 [Tulasnella sp. 408]